MSDISDIEELLPSTTPHISKKAENAVQNILQGKRNKKKQKIISRKKVRYLLLSSFILLTKSETFEEFYDYVNGQIAAAANYTLPTNNEKLYGTSNSSLKCFGCWDFIIIGGGSAGSLLAGRLSEVRKWKILLLEAGGNQTEFTDIPAMQGNSLRSDKNWGYFTSPQTTACQGMLNKRCVYPRGKVLGGCATVNGIINARGIPQDYDDWEKLGNPGWAYKEVLPFFKSFEKVDFPNADPIYYGQNGYIHVNYTYPPSTVADAFLNANIQNGLPEIDYNGKGIQGVSRAQLHIKGIKRDNSAHAFVDPAQDRPNLKIALNAFVTKILIKNNVAYGVEFIKDGQTYQATSKKEVILSAGAINSPQILLLSGVGPAEELRAKGITPIVDLPAVGKHLKDHPLFPNFFFRTNKTALSRSLRENLQRYLAGLTPFTNGANLEMLAFMNTKSNSKLLRNIELLTFAPPFSVPPKPLFAYNFNEEYVKAYSQYSPLTDFAVMVILLKSKSEGSVTLQSNSPKDFPIIDINYLSDPNNEDIEDMYQGIKYALSLAETPAFKSVNATVISTQPACENLKSDPNDRKYWYCAIRHATSTIYHPVGTTRMGNCTESSVVNTDLKVHKLKKLRIVDAGVMPEIISGHTNSPTYMIAEKISYKIKLNYGVK